MIVSRIYEIYLVWLDKSSRSTKISNFNIFTKLTFFIVTVTDAVQGDLHPGNGGTKDGGEMVLQLRV